MKVLMVSDNKINGIGGGSLVEKRNYLGILNALKGTDFELSVISPDEELEHLQKHFVVEKNKKMDLKARLRGHSTFYYMQFNKIKEYIDLYKPDILFLGRSRLGFIAKYVKKKYPNTKVVSCMENIEYDYINGYFANTKLLKRIPSVLLEKKCVRRDERDAILYADVLFFLSERDIQRARHLYKIAMGDKTIFICPICINDKINLTLKSEKKTIAFIGSLNYSSNSSAIKSFLNDVWKDNFSNNKDVELIIAGRGPEQDLIDLAGKFENCRVIPEFSSLPEIIPEHSLIIAPIAKGAGMKTKIAECLSMGLPAIGSNEALVGYEDALRIDKLSSLYRSNTSSESIKAINSFLALTDDMLESIKKQNQAIFDELYSYKRAYRVFDEAFKFLANK